MQSVVLLTGRDERADADGKLQKRILRNMRFFRTFKNDLISVSIMIRS